jgi:conjugative transfer region protein TrbK
VDTKLLARIGAVIFVAIAITMTAIEMSRSPEAGRDGARVARPAGALADPLLAELQRCQMLGASGATDPSCLRAWAENRRRFLAPGARPAARIADGVAPVTHAASPVTAGASPKEN